MFHLAKGFRAFVGQYFTRSFVVRLADRCHLFYENMCNGYELDGDVE